MHFNDGYERKKFIKAHERMRKEYREAGMTDEEIDEIFLYDRDRYKEQRNYCLHDRYILHLFLDSNKNINLRDINSVRSV